VLLGLNACNINSSQNKFSLAERLLEDKKYDAAISEYQDVVNKEPYTELGISALFKIAQTHHLYLGRMKEAQNAYSLYFKRLKDPAQQIVILQILAKLSFEEFEDYNEAIRIYGDLINRSLSPEETEKARFQIGRCLFLQNRFDESVAAFEQLKTKHPDGKLLGRAELEIANATSAKGRCRDALPRFEKVAKLNPELGPLAIFAEATCYEELDDLDKAHELLDSIKNTYPSPQVVALKMNKIKRRKILRKR
jgi:tetratricopeptide (TPR) repeat protein